MTTHIREWTSINNKSETVFVGNIPVTSIYFYNIYAIKNIKLFFFYFLGSGQRKQFDLSSKASEETPILLSFLGFVNLYHWFPCAPTIHVSFFLPYPQTRAFVSNTIGVCKMSLQETSWEEALDIVIFSLAKVRLYGTCRLKGGKEE